MNAKTPILLFLLALFVAAGVQDYQQAKQLHALKARVKALESRMEEDSTFRNTLADVMSDRAKRDEARIEQAFEYIGTNADAVAYWINSNAVPQFVHLHEGVEMLMRDAIDRDARLQLANSNLVQLITRRP